MFFLKDLPTHEMVERYAGDYDAARPDDVLSTLTRMREASLLLRRLETYFAEHGLSQLRFLIMIVIDREPERDELSLSELAERLDVSRPVLTRTVKSLDEEGLIALCGSETDRRRKTLSLTGAGKERLRALLPDYFRILTGEVPA